MTRLSVESERTIAVDVGNHTRINTLLSNSLVDALCTGTDTMPPLVSSPLTESVVPDASSTAALGLTHTKDDETSAALVAARLYSSITSTARCTAVPESAAVLTTSTASVRTKRPATTSGSTVSWPSACPPPPRSS